MTIAWPDSLVREIAERRTLIFIGAGISKAAHADLPTWTNLLESLGSKIDKKKDKQLIKSLIGQGRLLDAAQIIRDSIPKAELTAELRKIFQVRPIPHSEIYNDLLLLDPKVIITTNYDEFIEKNFEHFSKGQEAHSISDHGSSKLLNDLRSPIRSIVKIHGCISDPAKVVLDRVSYYNARRENAAIFSIVQSLMTVNTVLFIGYSMSDPDIQVTLENISLNSPSDHSHYALVPKFDHISLRNSLTGTYNIGFLEYPKGNHAAVPEAIKGLREAVVNVRSARGIV